MESREDKSLFQNHVFTFKISSFTTFICLLIFLSFLIKILNFFKQNRALMCPKGPLFNKTDDFIIYTKMIDLLSKTGLGRSGHDGSQSFGPIWHTSGPKMVFWRNDIVILHYFCWRSSKIKLFRLKTLIFDQKSRKYPNKIQKYVKIGFPRNS